MDNNCQPLGTIESYDMNHGGTDMGITIEANNWTFCAVSFGDIPRPNRGTRLNSASLMSHM